MINSVETRPFLACKGLVNELVNEILDKSEALGQCKDSPIERLDRTACKRNGTSTSPLKGKWSPPLSLGVSV